MDGKQDTGHRTKAKSEQRCATTEFLRQNFYDHKSQVKTTKSCKLAPNVSRVTKTTEFCKQKGSQDQNNKSEVRTQSQNNYIARFFVVQSLKTLQKHIFLTNKGIKH